jgi:hypothetical protein
MNAVVKHDEPSTAVTEYSGGLLEVIARAARDPNVDIDKMERLIEMQERVQKRNAEMAFHTAMAEMQPHLPVVDERGGIKDRNGNTQSTYAYWEDINEAIRPILSEHGFSLTFKGHRENDMLITVGILAHRDGHKETTEIQLPADTSGSKNAVQAIGSSKSYGKRYAAFDLLNITTRGQDDNGVKGGSANLISVKQYNELLRRISEVGADKDKFAAYLRDSKKMPGLDLTELPERNLEFAMSALASKVAK